MYNSKLMHIYTLLVTDVLVGQHTHTHTHLYRIYKLEQRSSKPTKGLKFQFLNFVK